MLSPMVKKKDKGYKTLPFFFATAKFQLLLQIRYWDKKFVTTNIVTSQQNDKKEMLQYIQEYL